MRIVMDEYELKKMIEAKLKESIGYTVQKLDHIQLYCDEIAGQVSASVDLTINPKFERGV